MEEIALQYKDGLFYPFSEEDNEKAKSFKENQIVKAKISGVQKHRSYQQLKLYWACCKVVSNNTEDINWDTKEKVDVQNRMRTQFFNEELTVIAGNKVIFTPRSISYNNLRHIEASKFFDRAFEIMAKFLEVSLDELLSEGNKQWFGNQLDI